MKTKGEREREIILSGILQKDFCVPNDSRLWEKIVINLNTYLVPLKNLYIKTMVVQLYSSEPK